MTTSRVKLTDVIGPAFYTVHNAVKAETVTELVLKGGRGSVKSSCASAEILLAMQRHPDCHAVVLRKVGNTLRNSVFAQMQWAIRQLGLSRFFKATVSPMEITDTRTGQKIFFFGLDDPDNVKSIKVPFGYCGILWFEEADQYDGPEEMRNVEQSVFRGGDYTLGIKSFNPPAMQRNFMNQYALDAAPGKLVHHSTYLEVPPEWLGKRFLADAAHLKETKPIAYRHEYLGEVVGNGTQVFDNLKLVPISDQRIEAFNETVSGVDWGWYPDPWAFNRVSYDSARRTLYVFDELTRQKAANQETAALVSERIPMDELIICDSAEQKSVGDYRAFGLRSRPSVKGPNSVRESMKWLQGLSAIVIDPKRCPDTAKEFSEYEYERDRRTGMVQSEYVDLNNHHIDAVRYATNNIWKRRGT